MARKPKPTAIPDEVNVQFADGVVTISVSCGCDFKPDTDQTRVLAPGITGIWAVEAEEPGETEAPELKLRALRFDTAKYSLEQALKWVQDYSYTVSGVQFSSESDYVERDADLFQAGEYPDRDLTVTQADIARLAAIESPIPIQIGHDEQKIKVGEVVGLTASGDWLKGKLKMLPQAYALLQEIGVKGLSIAVPRTLDSINHVAVTGTPRVAGAQVFSGADPAGLVLFSLGEQPTGGNTMPETVSVEEFAELKANMAAMQKTVADSEAARQAAEQKANDAVAQSAAIAFTMRQRECEALVEKFSAGPEPRFTPAGRELAVAILMHGDSTVKFSGEDKPISALFSQFLDLLPPLGFKPAMPSTVFSGADGDAKAIASLTPAQVEFAGRMGIKGDTDEGKAKLAAFARNLVEVKTNSAAA